MGKSGNFFAIFSAIFVCIFTLSPISALELSVEHSDEDCLIPFSQQGFTIRDVYNDFDGDNPKHLQSNDIPRGTGLFRVADALRYRYIVGDLNTQHFVRGEKQCRGVEEIYPSLEDLREFDGSEDERPINNYLSQVESFRPKAPLTKPPVIKFRGQNYCIGQRILACELRFDRRLAYARRIARFVTSTKNSDHIFNGYYAPINRIAQRAWDERPYTKVDFERDLISGGGKGSVVNFFEKKLPMPNFMYFVGLPGFKFVDGNGLHKKTAAEGMELRDFMGAPISLGCVRLNDFAAKFMRWFTPRGARFFIHYDRELYQKHPAQALKP